MRREIGRESIRCSEALVTTGNCIDPEVESLISDRACDEFKYDPFTVYAYNTDAIPGHTLAQHEANAIARLTNGEQRTVEQVLWQRLLVADPVPTDMSGFPGWPGVYSQRGPGPLRDGDAIPPSIPGGTR